MKLQYNKMLRPHFQNAVALKRTPAKLSNLKNTACMFGINSLDMYDLTEVNNEACYMNHGTGIGQIRVIFNF